MKKEKYIVKVGSKVVFSTKSKEQALLVFKTYAKMAELLARNEIVIGRDLVDSFDLFDRYHFEVSKPKF